MLLATCSSPLSPALDSSPSIEPSPLPADQDCTPDRDLVRQASAGDTRAFERLYRRHVRRVHSVIWRLIGGVDARAEELAQDTFLHAWRGLAGFRLDSAFSTWLHRLAVNTALMDLRGRAGAEAMETAADALDSMIAPAVRHDLGLDLERLVARLPPRARAVLVLHDVEGWKHAEIGAALGMAVGSSKAQLHRARGLLRVMLGSAE
jgi:RNA polymerase sigma-70 factor (ECF subfamily)